MPKVVIYAPPMQVATLYHPTGPLLPRHWAFVPDSAADSYGGRRGLLLLTDKRASAVYAQDVAAEPGENWHRILPSPSRATGSVIPPMTSFPAAWCGTR